MAPHDFLPLLVEAVGIGGLSGVVGGEVSRTPRAVEVRERVMSVRASAGAKAGARASESVEPDGKAEAPSEVVGRLQTNTKRSATAPRAPVVGPTPRATHVVLVGARLLLGLYPRSRACEDEVCWV